jgi:aryl-alcohol dehydrogenase-like predicted oxidoreductase
VRAALDNGITSFDTADVYANGRAEEVLGAALRGERRESLEIFTKVYWVVGPEPRGKNDMGLSRKHIMEGIEGSLRRLGTDYVDLYQAHRFDLFTPLEETMQAFADVVRAGKALYIGVSEWTPDQIRRGHALATDLGISLVSSQPQYSALWRIIEDEVVPTCQELGLGQIVWSPVAQGVLTGKYRPGQPRPEGSRATDDKGGATFIRSLMRDEVLTRVQDLRPIAGDLGLTMAQLAVAWVLQNPAVSAALVGASRPEQVAENAKAAGVKIPTDAMARIDEVLGGRSRRSWAQDGPGSALRSRSGRAQRGHQGQQTPAGGLPVVGQQPVEQAPLDHRQLGGHGLAGGDPLARRADRVAAPVGGIGSADREAGSLQLVDDPHDLGLVQVQPCGQLHLPERAPGQQHEHLEAPQRQAVPARGGQLGRAEAAVQLQGHPVQVLAVRRVHVVKVAD